MSEPTMNHTWLKKPKERTSRVARVFVVLGACAAAGACHVTVDPIRVEPIHLTLDITLRVDRELDRFFDFEDQAPLPETAPAREGDQS